MRQRKNKKEKQIKEDKEKKQKISKVRKEKHTSVKTAVKTEQQVIKEKTAKKKHNIVNISTAGITPKEIADIVKRPLSTVITELMKLGVYVSEKDVITDPDVIVLIFDQFKYKVNFVQPTITETKKEEKVAPSVQQETITTVEVEEITSVKVQPKIPEIKPPKKEIPPNWIKKVPVVTVMGHVDHGKTTLLDTIMKTNITAKEPGQITQHIGAYKVTTPHGCITFIDTPGHEAFSTLRARGAKVTDIVVLVVAGDEGIMPQTKEAIELSKSAGVPIIVAINKIDLPQCNPNNVKKQFADIGIIPKEWGGNTEFVEISARNNINIDKLLDTIILQAEIMELYVPIDVPCEATVIETKHDDKRGFTATVIVNKGKLKIGDSFVCGYSYGKVRAMFDNLGNRVNELLPGEPAAIIGFETKTTTAGEILKVVESEKKAKEIYEELERKRKIEAERIKSYRTIDDIISGKVNELSLVIKTDTQGSLEAIQKMLGYLSMEIQNNPNLPKLKIAGSSVGEISESDVLLASASNAVIIGFNVRPNTQALKRAKIENIEIRTYRIIYELIDDVRKILQRLEVKKEVEEVLGRARVKKVFEISKVGKVAGCIVEEGKLVRNARVRLLRDGVIIVDTTLASLKHFKEDVKEIQAGYECGVRLENYQDIKENDIIECYHIVKS